MKFNNVAFVFALFALTRADNEQKRKELHSQCGIDFNRGEYYNKVDLTDFPWLALLRYETRDGDLKLLCGGVLISDQYILTAAHCLDSPSNTLHSVILGEHNTETNPDCIDYGHGISACNHFVRIYGVNETIIHEDYNSFSFNAESKADLALVKLSNKVQFSDFIQPICLPESPEKEKQTYFVAGWGKSMAPGGTGFTEKLVSRAQSLAPEDCWKYPVNPDYSSEDHICAGANQRVCVADAGGPLMNYEYRTDGDVGMTVFGVGFMDLTCQYKGVPGIFTKVHKYVPWIESHIFS